MAGHSKWANIKHRKGRSDAERGKIFTKIGRELQVAVRAGGADPSTNSRLRDAIAKAKQNNMPADNIKRSIEKAAGASDTSNYENLVYEGYGAGGLAVIVETLTDNKNRTTGDVRHAFDKYGGSLGTTGCVSYMFEKKGIIVVDKADEDALTLDALEAGADDIEKDGDVFIITTPFNLLYAVAEGLGGYKILSAEVDYVPQNRVKPSAEDIVKIDKMLDILNDSDDVQAVYHNGDIEL